ncbi:MAG: 50S ribosomal protein L15 [Methanomicrobia archaeon]|nr:50S ribosomal protein L15 [Methanomicrobia archaeon]
MTVFNIFCQNPIFRRIPKRGFKNGSKVSYAIVNVASLNRFEDGVVVTPALLIDSGLVKKEFDGVKILGNGELTKKLTVQANAFSKTAEEAIKNAGGTIEVL